MMTSRRCPHCGEPIAVMIGEILRRERIAAGLQVLDVASALGCRSAKVSKLERGSLRLSLKDAVMLSRLYGVSVLRLAGEECHDGLSELSQDEG